MSQETPTPKTQDCPYPAFREITTEMVANGTVLTLPGLTAYLTYCHQKSTPRTELDVQTHFGLHDICDLVFSLLTNDSLLKSSSPTSQLDISQEYTSSRLVLEFTNLEENLPPVRSIMANQSLALWHGGITLANTAHFKTLLSLAIRAIEREAVILLGLERTEYLELKDRKYPRPWPFIVTTSILHHLAGKYRIPLRYFIMPEIPRPERNVPYPKTLCSHSEAIYLRILNSRTPTYLVVTGEDVNRNEKIQSMIRAGLGWKGFHWCVFPKTSSLSTSEILRQVETGSFKPSVQSIRSTTAEILYRAWLSRRVLPK